MSTMPQDQDRPQDQDWEARLRAGLGSAPVPDFHAWCERNPDVLTGLQPMASSVQPNSNRDYLNRRMMMTTFKFIAASVLIASGIVWFGSGDRTLSSTAFADVIPGVDDVETMTWTTTYYIRSFSRDGSRTWIQTERRLHAYRHPGQYRETMLDDQGEVTGIHITNVRADRMLALDVKGKKAVLKAPVIPYGERPPFAYVGDIIRERKTGSESSRIKSVSLQGQKEFDEKQTNVVRAIIESIGIPGQTRHDYMFDVTSKQLVGVWTSDEPDFDYAAAPELSNPADAPWYKMVPIGGLHHELVLNPKLDPSDFSLDPPTDYAFEKIAAPTVTEEEMIAYLGAAARFNDNNFPDSPYEVFDRDKLNAAWEKEESARTAEANQLIELINKVRFREIYQPPVRQFVDDHTTLGSFHYVGSGVSIGQSDRIVCWYRLRNAATYRAVYGDLSVKDVSEADLPLRLSK